MKIHIDASRALDERPTGVNVYAREIILHLSEQLSDQDELILYAPGWLQGRETKVFPNVIATWKFLDWKPKFLWTQICLMISWFFADKKDAVFFAPAHVAPIITPHNTVVVIHDIAFEFLSEAFTRSERLFARFMTRINAHVARRILVPSQDTKDGLVSRISVPKEKIFVTPFALPSSISFEVTDEQKKVVCKKYNLDKPFILSVGRIEYKKGVDRLIRAFEFIKRNGFEGELVLIGKPGVGYEKIISIIDKSLYRDSIRLLGYVDDADMSGLYAGARVFALATRYEGFGFIFLEAMKRGVPVVSFDVGSVKEVVGDAALLASNEHEFGELLERSLVDEALRAELVRRGFQRAQEFDWKKTAAMTKEVLCQK